MAWEGFRWFSPMVFLTVVLLTVFLFILDMCSGFLFIEELEAGELSYFSAHAYFGEGSVWLSNVGLCLVIFVSTDLYAQDYEEGTVYMRIQRMGVGSYAGVRTMQVCVSTWLVGCISMLLVLPVFSLIFQVPLVPEDPEAIQSISTSSLLSSGNTVGFLASMGILSGFRSMFYALLTLVVSFFIPRRRMLVAVPLLLWYFFQYVFSWLEWLPQWMQPREVFSLVYGSLNSERLGLGSGLSEWAVLGFIAGGMFLLAVIVWVLFILRLRRNGVFGGEQSE